MSAGRIQLAVVGLACLSLVAYAALGRPRDADAARRGTQFAGGPGTVLLHWLIWLLGPLERSALRLGATPATFNASGVVLAALGGALVARGSLEAGSWTIALGGMCDILDGRLARARGEASPYGAFVDSVLDRFADVVSLLGFAWYLRSFAAGPFLAAAAIGGSLLVSYTRARGESLNVSGKVGLMRRGERVALLFLMGVLDAPIARATGWAPGSAVWWGMAFMAAATFATAAHRTVWIARQLRETAR